MLLSFLVSLSTNWKSGSLKQNRPSMFNADQAHLCFLVPTRCFLLVSSWFPLGFLLVSSWFPLGFLLVSSWFPLGFLLVSSWFPLGFLLVSNLKHAEIPAENPAVHFFFSTWDPPPGKKKRKRQNKRRTRCLPLLQAAVQRKREIGRKYGELLAGCPHLVLPQDASRKLRRFLGGRTLVGWGWLEGKPQGNPCFLLFFGGGPV